MSDKKDILKYSNPKIVYMKAYDLFGDDIDIEISTRNNKKYMIRGNFSNWKWIHFGNYGMLDYTKHKNEKRRNNFLTRNNKWKYADEDTPAFLSYNLLW
jgi:hypothetical protein